MATRSNIAIKNKNGSVDSIYCHWDGYLTHNGSILLNSYTDVDKIKKLISLGDISSLADNVEPSSGEHSFDKPQANVVVAYGRDRGEENTQTLHWNSIEEYLHNVDEMWIEYVYIYDEQEQKWFYIGGDADSLTELTKDITERRD